MTNRIAKLVFDSATMGQQPGVRSGTAGRRTLLYECPEIGADLVVFSGQQGAAPLIYGQVFWKANEGQAPGARVSLAVGGAETRTDESGQFTLGICSATQPREVEIEMAGVTMTCRLPPEVDSLC